LTPFDKMEAADMKCNIGKTDKMIRIVIGIVIAILGIAFKSWWGLLAIIPLGTAAVGWCALYVPLKISTAKKVTEEKKT
jgi:Inner membrane protein YgaP-like, transmembrane domain